jgi:hypothetical protein
MAQGDQIYVLRPYLQIQGLYEHHGIDCGDGTVIHYRKTNETISRTPFLTFSHGLKIHLKSYLKNFCFVPEIVIQRAISRLGEQQYNLLFNNCEHFATWCKTGISYSKQIRDFLPIITQLDLNKLNEPIQQSLQTTDPHNAQKLINEALASIKIVWNDLQPKYQQQIQEFQTWEKVAFQALNNHREDLAREAIKRKLEAKKQAQALETQLQQLATMTENLIQNSMHNQG